MYFLLLCPYGYFTMERFVHICLYRAKHCNAEIIYLIDNVCTYTYNKTKIKQGVISNMDTTNINVRVDSALKQEAEALFNDLGLNMSSAINMFLRSAISHNGIPFEIKRLTPNAETRAALGEYEEMKQNPGNYKRYESFDEVLDEVLDDA